MVESPPSVLRQRHYTIPIDKNDTLRQLRPRLYLRSLLLDVRAWLLRMMIFVTQPLEEISVMQKTTRQKGEKIMANTYFFLKIFGFLCGHVCGITVIGAI